MGGISEINVSELKVSYKNLSSQKLKKGRNLEPQILLL
jgi:hypothetical protein